MQTSDGEVAVLLRQNREFPDRPVIRIIKNNRLSGDNVKPFVEAHAYDKKSIIKPDAIIIHYTAGASGAATVNLFKASSATTSAPTPDVLTSLSV